MDIYREELAGREFDWLGIDIDGNIAMFSTAGVGPIPQIVIEDYKVYDAIFDEIESPNWGSESVWDDYSKLGFYVYDWEPNSGPYIKQRTPESKMSKKLSDKVLAIKRLHKLNFRFSETNEVISM